MHAFDAVLCCAVCCVLCVVQDADLLLLSLLCHEPYFTVMRENMEAGVRQGGAQMRGGGSLGGRVTRFCLPSLALQTRHAACGF